MLSFKRPKPGLRYAPGSPIRPARTRVPAGPKSLLVHPKWSKSRLKLSSLRRRHINHCFPRSCMTKTKGLRAQGDQQEVLVHRSASLWLRVPACPAGLGRNETHKEHLCAHLNKAHFIVLLREKVAVISRNNILVNAFPIIIQSLEFFHRRLQGEHMKAVPPLLCEIVIVIDQNKSLHMNPLYTAPTPY